MSTRPDNPHDAALLANCPFPDVANTLLPFIKPRQQADEIRQGLHAKLPVSPFNPVRPQLPPDAEVTGLHGVRKAYWKALDAHQAAQAKYESLKAELHQLAQTPVPSAQHVEHDASFLSATHLPFVRQKEKQRKLAIIEATVAKIAAAGNGALLTESLDNVTKREVGDVPQPPATAFSGGDLGSDADYDLIRLKQAILSTRDELEEHDHFSTQANGAVRGDVDPQADLRALQKAHHELTLWMENQLAMIGDVEAPKREGGAFQGNPATHADVANALDEIEDLYEQYLETRQALVETVANPPQVSTPLSPDGTLRASNTFDSEPHQSTSETLLPYISRLAAMKHAEHTLLQQSGYTRRQLTSSETQTHAVLTRLADESHLLQPGIHREVPHGVGWKKASIDADKSNTSAIVQRLEAGNAAAENAKDVLLSVKNMPQSVHALLE